MCQATWGKSRVHRALLALALAMLAMALVDCGAASTRSEFAGPDWIMYGLPLLLAAIGLAAMGLYARRSDRKLVLAAFALFAATDSILSLMLYVPNVIGG